LNISPFNDLPYVQVAIHSFKIKLQSYDFVGQKGHNPGDNVFNIKTLIY